MTPETRLTEADTEALQRALEAVRMESKEDAARLDSLAERQGWFEAASTAAYRCQVRNLHLRPWHCPPMDCGDVVFKNGGYGNTAKEVRLRLRMKALGLSVFEPFPAEALEQVAGRRAQRGAPTAPGKASSPASTGRAATVSIKSTPVA
jgi:hypothetical protein